MSTKKNKHNHKQAPKKVNQQQKTVNQTSSDLLDLMDNFFSKRSNLFLYLSLAFVVIFGAMLFDARVSLTGDDAMYIIRAYDFIHHFKYPDFQGPLYPIILSPFVLIFGIHVISLKLVSFAFILAQTAILYLAFRNKIPAGLLVVTSILISMNAYVLYFASQTYNEALFMMLQSIMFLVFFKYFITDNKAGEPIKIAYKYFILLGFMLFLMGLTRTIGYIAFGAITLYFLYNKKWLAPMYTLVAFGIFFFGFQLIKGLIWNDADVQFQNQANSLLLKNYYNAAEGYESLGGYFMRIVDNSQLYLSKHLFMMLGLRPDMNVQPNITGLTLLSYFVFFAGLVVVALKKNKYLLFTAIYVLSMVGMTFVVLQKTWDQGRFIVTYMPFIVLTILTAFYYGSKFKKTKFLQFSVYLVALVLFFSTFKRTSDRSVTTREVLERNMDGNMFYGFSPDWVHYLQMSQWAAENVADSLNIACRKPSISFIYTEGRKFTGIFRLKTLSVEENLKKLRSVSDKQVLSINIRELEQKGIPPTVTSALRVMSHSFLTGSLKDAQNQDVDFYLFGLYQIPWESAQGILDLLDEYGVQYSVNAEIIEALQQNVPKDHKLELSAVSPDDLLNDLKDKEVKYIIMASLRKIPMQKTQYTINTVYRYLYFISLKYPNIFRVVKQIGNNEDEPAQLIEIL